MKIFYNEHSESMNLFDIILTQKNQSFEKAVSDQSYKDRSVRLGKCAGASSEMQSTLSRTQSKTWKKRTNRPWVNERKFTPQYEN